MSETLITWPDVCVFCGDSNGKVGRTANEHWKQFRCGTEYEVIEGKTAWIQDDECKIAELRTALAAATKRAEEAEAKIVSMRAGCDSTIENYRKQEHELVKQIAEFERTVAGCRALIATLRT